MKKIVIILAAMVACLATSCQKPFEYTVFALDNQEVNLPKTVSGVSEFVYYAHITSNGPWEAKLETADGNSWCWLQEYYVDSKGAKVKVVEPIQSFEGMEEMGRWNVVRGDGTIWLPVRFVTTTVNRYATLTVRRTDTGEVKVLRIVQK